MKRTLPYQILLALGLLFTAGCEKEEEDTPVFPIQIFATGPGHGGESWGPEYYKNGEITQLYANAKVYLYGSEEDYLLRRNHLHEGVTNENGMYYKEFGSPQKFWVYVEKGNLNNSRFTINSALYGYDLGCNNRNHNYVEVERKLYEFEELPASKGELFLNKSLFSTLSANVAKLSLHVRQNGAPVTGAVVTLYLSQEAYEQNRPANMELDEMKTSYGVFTPELAGKGCLVKSFVRPTNEEGEVYFPNLEPRQYWFKVEKDGKTNAGGTIDTGKALPDNPDITTSLTVGIQ